MENSVEMGTSYFATLTYGSDIVTRGQMNRKREVYTVKAPANGLYRGKGHLKEVTE